MQVWLTHYCNEEEANGKMFRQIGDISPSKFIHSSPRKIRCIIIYKKKYLYQEKQKKNKKEEGILHICITDHLLNHNKIRWLLISHHQDQTEILIQTLLHVCRSYNMQISFSKRKNKYLYVCNLLIRKPHDIKIN